MTLACLASQSCTELGPAQPQLVIHSVIYVDKILSYEVPGGDCAHNVVGNIGQFLVVECRLEGAKNYRLLTNVLALKFSDCSQK